MWIVIWVGLTCGFAFRLIVFVVAVCLCFADCYVFVVDLWSRFAGLVGFSGVCLIVLVTMWPCYDCSIVLYFARVVGLGCLRDLLLV